MTHFQFDVLIVVVIFHAVATLVMCVLLAAITIPVVSHWAWIRKMRDIDVKRWTTLFEHEETDAEAAKRERENLVGLI